MPGAIRIFKKKRKGVVDTTPNPISFNNISGVSLNTFIESNTVTVTGIVGAVSVSVTPEILVSVNGGAWTNANPLIQNGQTLKARMYSYGNFNGTTSGTVTVGTLSMPWSITAKAEAVHLNFISSNNVPAIPSIYISGNTLFGGIGMGSSACCIDLNIPKDGNWWYWEAQQMTGSASTQNKIGYSAQSAAQQSAGTTGFSGYAISSTVGIGIKWYAASNVWVVAQQQASGAIAVGGTIAASTVAIHPAIYTAGSPTSVKIKFDGHQFAPNFASLSTAAMYQGNTYKIG